METNSEGENQNRGTSGGNNNIGNSNEGQSKPKRQMKTPFQLEALEKAYACPCTSFLMLLLFFELMDVQIGFCCNFVISYVFFSSLYFSFLLFYLCFCVFVIVCKC